MKTIKFLSLLATAAILFNSCSDDDDAPEEIHEEEVITTITVTLTPEQGGEAVTLQSRDLDGGGPDAPIITVGNLQANTVYNGEIELLNETETPVENITEEVEEEGDDHQFIFVTSGSIASVDYTDQDEDGNPVGLEFSLTTGEAGSANLAITLRHEPTKPNDGSLNDAGGETDIAQSFDLVVE